MAFKKKTKETEAEVKEKEVKALEEQLAKLKEQAGVQEAEEEEEETPVTESVDQGEVRALIAYHLNRAFALLQEL